MGVSVGTGVAVGIADGDIDGLRVCTIVAMEAWSISTPPSSAESARALSKASDPSASAIEMASSSPVLSAMLESDAIIEKDTSQATIARRRRCSVSALLLLLLLLLLATTAMEKPLMALSGYPV